MKRKKSTLLPKARKAVKKPKKTAEPRSGKEEMVTLFEKVTKETEAWTRGRGHKREILRTAFFLWLTLPVRYRGAPDAVLTQLGLSGDMLELARIKGVTEFGETFDIGRGALAEWGREFDKSDESKDAAAMFRSLMREGLGALYRKLIENGDADRFKTFAAYVEGWVPMMGIQHKTDPGETLTDEERESLDKLLEKNTVAV